MLSQFFDSDISPIFPFSPLFDTTLSDEDIHFFNHNPHHHHLLQPHDPSVLSEYTSSEAISESERHSAMEAWNNNDTIMNKDTSQGDESIVRGNKTSSSAIRKTPKKRLVTKDRHSKIVTAQGPRDRRMRLSYDIAIKFFKLQDMLGFDKASKTVGWLLTKSQAAINELTSVSQPKLSCTGSFKSVSSTSECEVVSIVDEMPTDDIQQVNISSGKSSPGIGKERKARQSRKATFYPLSKASREKARARARERTIGKKHDQSCQQVPEVRLLNPQNLRPSNSFAEDSGSQSHELSSTFDVLTADMELTSRPDCQGHIQDIVNDQSFTIGNKTCSSSIFEYPQELEISLEQGSNWTFSDWSKDPTGSTSSYCSMISTDTDFSYGNLDKQVIPDSNLNSEFAGVQVYRPWEPYTTQGLCLQH